jgi:hypothetical protein
METASNLGDEGSCPAKIWPVTSTARKICPALGIKRKSSGVQRIFAEPTDMVSILI